MLKLREKHCLARNVRNSIVDDLKCVCGVITTTLCDIVRKQLQEAGISADNNEQLQQVLNVENSISGAFDDISSEYKLTKFCKENLGMIEPREHVLGFSAKGKKESFQYIPLPELLKFLLSQSDVRENIMRQQKAVKSCSLLTDYTDGLLMKSHSVLSTGSDCIRIHLYNDEFEVVNLLGSKKGTHKVSGFYFFIGNLGPKFRSQLRHIHLVLMVRFQVQQKYGYSAVLQPLIDDLKQVSQTGITVDASSNSCDFSNCFSRQSYCTFACWIFIMLQQWQNMSTVYGSSLRNSREI